MKRLNFAPTERTIIVALVLVIVGLFGTFGTDVPDEAGIIAFLGATIVLPLGMVFEQI